MKLVASYPTRRAEVHPAGTRPLLIRCPNCAAHVDQIGENWASRESSMLCSNCLMQFRWEEGIWHALTGDRQKYFERFIVEYQSIRQAEGRGSQNAAYYLALPFRDLTGRNQGQWKIRARTFEYVEQRILPQIEKQRSAPLNVLDLGAGNGWLSYRLALRGHRPVAVDLATNQLDGLGAAVNFQSRVPALFPRFQAELDRLPFCDGQFDLAIFNASFHYSENYSRTLGEAIRCLRKPGVVVIADSPWYARAESGQIMLAERHAAFLSKYGLASDSIKSLEFLTDQRLAELEKQFAIRWEVHRPAYGWKWNARPWMARLLGKREPSQFRTYVAAVNE